MTAACLKAALVQVAVCRRSRKSNSPLKFVPTTKAPGLKTLSQANGIRKLLMMMYWGADMLSLDQLMKVRRKQGTCVGYNDIVCHGIRDHEKFPVSHSDVILHLGTDWCRVLRR